MSEYMWSWLVTRRISPGAVLLSGSDKPYTSTPDSKEPTCGAGVRRSHPRGLDS